jgi:hypothetical protein
VQAESHETLDKDYAEKQAETLFRLIFCERKTLFQLKK